jgi:putative tricarboxylic transport membrane protein
VLAIKWTIARAAVIGTSSESSGAGATIASFLAYGTEVKVSKTPEIFGTGAVQGIAAAETANNAATGGSMVPLLTLGIPGGNSAAVMMSALMLQGVQLGPILLKSQPLYLTSTFASIVVTNIVMVAVALVIAKWFNKIRLIPYSLMGTTILVLASVGSFSLQNSVSDVVLMMLAGIFGYAFIKYKFSPAALVLGLVLGGLCEANLRRAVALANGNYMIVFSRPISATLLTVCLLLLFAPIVLKIKSKLAKKCPRSNKPLILANLNQKERTIYGTCQQHVLTNETGEPVVGCQLRSMSAASRSFWVLRLDYVFIDGEHFAYHMEHAEGIIRAVQLSALRLSCGFQATSRIYRAGA